MATKVVEVDIEKMFEGTELGEAYHLAHSPTLQALSDNDLQRRVRPTVKQAIVKQKFWREYERVCKERTPFQVINVYHPEMSRYRFYSLLKVREFCAWLFRAPHSYVDVLEALSEAGINKVSEIFNAEMFDATTGKLDTKVGALVLKAWEAVENRHKGLAIQKIEEKSLKLTGTVDSSQTIDDLRKRLEHLKQGDIDES